MSETDDPATTIYGRLLWHHMDASRKNFDGPERKKLFDLIEAFRALFPDECKVWEDRYSDDARDVGSNYHSPDAGNMIPTE